MFRRCWSQTTLFAAVALAALASAPSSAQEPVDSDTKEISSYVLTEATLAKYLQATKNLGPLAKGVSGDCAEEDAGESARSLSDLTARFDAIPGAQAAIKAGDMTTREYLVFTIATFHNAMAAWALDQPGGKLPPWTSMANVTFYRTHEAALQKVGKETQSADCDDDDDAGEYED